MSETVKRPDPKIAAQALAEAKARKDKQLSLEGKKVAPKEFGGRGGADPARFGDWEVNGITYDF